MKHYSPFDFFFKKKNFFQCKIHFQLPGKEEDWSWSTDCTWETLVSDPVSPHSPLNSWEMGDTWGNPGPGPCKPQLFRPHLQGPHQHRGVVSAPRSATVYGWTSSKKKIMFAGLINNKRFFGNQGKPLPDCSLRQAIVLKGSGQMWNPSQGPKEQISRSCWSTLVSSISLCSWRLRA